jgi:hypothetical protein
MAPAPFEFSTTYESVPQPEFLLDIWMRIYEDSLKKVDPEISARRASAAVSGLPEELKEEIATRFKLWSNVRIEVQHE